MKPLRMKMNVKAVITLRNFLPFYLQIPLIIAILYSVPLFITVQRFKKLGNAVTFNAPFFQCAVLTTFITIIKEFVWAAHNEVKQAFPTLHAHVFVI